MKFTPFLLASVLTIVSIAPISADEDGKVEISKKRSFAKFETSSNEVQVESESTGLLPSSKTKFAMKFSTDGVPRFILNYFAKNSDTLAKVRVRAGILRLVEYNETIPVRTSNRRIIMASINKNNWSAFKTSSAMVNDVNVRSASTSVVSPVDSAYPNLNITIEAAVSDADVTKDGFQVSPNGFKFSIFISNWKCEYSQSRLALVTGLWTKNSIKFASEKNDSVDLGGIGAFEWEKTVIVDGSEQPVTISKSFSLTTDAEYTSNAGDDDVSENGKVLALSFPCGKNIAWDPRIIFGSPTSANLTAEGYSIRAPILALLFAMLMALLM